MNRKFEGKIKEKIVGNNVVFKIEYMDGDEKLIIKSIQYSKHYNKNKYKVNDKVIFELTEKNKAKIIDDELIEQDISTNPIGILLFIIFAIAVVSSVFLKNELMADIFVILFIVVAVGYIIIYIANAVNLANSGTIVKGKIISKKEDTWGMNDGQSSKSYMFVFEILHDNKVYKITDNQDSFTENLNVGDEIEISVYKNMAFWAKDIKKTKKDSK